MTTYTVYDPTTSAQLSPLLVTGYSARRPSRNVVHTVLGRPDPDVTLRAAGLRTGTLELLCANVADATEMADLHATVGVKAFEGSAPDPVSMDYVVAGEIEMEPSIETGRWIVRVGFQEVRL